MRNFTVLMLLMLIAVFSNQLAFADDTQDVPTPDANASPVKTIKSSSSLIIVENAITTAVSKSVDKMQSIGILWLSSFIMVQFLLTNISFLTIEH